MTELKAINGNTDGTKTKKDKTFKFPINFEKNYCCPIKPPYTTISSLNPAEIGMISSNFKFQAPH